MLRAGYTSSAQAGHLIGAGGLYLYSGDPNGANFFPLYQARVNSNIRRLARVNNDGPGWTRNRHETGSKSWYPMPYKRVVSLANDGRQRRMRSVILGALPVLARAC